MGKNNCVAIRLTIMNELMFDFGNQYPGNVKDYNTILACGVYVRDVKGNTLNLLMISGF